MFYDEIGSRAQNEDIILGFKNQHNQEGLCDYS